MTAERLATLRAIRLFRGQITYPELAVHLRITETCAKQRLERMKYPSSLVRKEGIGPGASFIMTKKGWRNLAYADDHLTEDDL